MASSTVGHTLPQVICCICGVTMQANAANTCAGCLQTKYDVTETINKSGVLLKCKGCERYQRDSVGWISCALESKELLAFCLKKVTGLKYVKLVDACFLWTEPHSKRIKLRLKVQKEVINGVILEESCVIEFVVQNKMCLDCHRGEANHTWSSVVQVRQKVTHKRTFLYLEQLIIKHKEYERTIKIDPMPDGVDFYFAARNEAVRFLDFLESVVPVRCKTSKHLVTSDAKENTAFFNHTFMVEMIPLCKDDLICLPKKLANKLGGINQIALCTSVTSVARVIDPLSCQFCEITSLRYWQNEFRPLAAVGDCIEFTVLDVRLMDNAYEFKERNFTRKKKRKSDAGEVVSRNISKRHSLAEIEVARTEDLGVNDERFTVLSHLGNLLKPGDSVLGYDLTRTNTVDVDDLDLRKSAEIPDVILVRKHYPLWRKCHTRQWKLKSLEMSANPNPEREQVGTLERDREQFMRDIEEDEEIRNKVNLYKTKVKVKFAQDVPSQEEAEDDAPRIAIESLLDDLNLNNPEKTE